MTQGLLLRPLGHVWLHTCMVAAAELCCLSDNSGLYSISEGFA